MSLESRVAERPMRSRLNVRLLILPQTAPSRIQVVVPEKLVEQSVSSRLSFIFFSRP